MKIRENKRPSALLSVRVGLRGFFLFSLSLSVSSFSGDQRWEPVRKAGPQVLPPSSVRPMWTILKVLYLVRAVSTDCTSELFNRRDLPVRVCLASVPLLFSFSLFFFLLFSCYSQKNRWHLFVSVGDAALRVPTSLKHSASKTFRTCCCWIKKPTPEKVLLLLLHKTNTGEGWSPVEVFLVHRRGGEGALSRRARWMGTCKTKPSFPEDWNLSREPKL